MSSRAAVVDLAAYRRSREQVQPPAASLPVPMMMAVWVLVPVVFYPGYF